MPNRFLNNITINDEYTFPSSDGDANQVIATDGSGNLSFVDQSGGASLSGGEASKVAVWSATDTLTHNDNFHFDTTNVRLGIGDSNPNRTLVVSETRTGSTASDAYTAIVKSVQSSGATPNPGTGGLKVQYTSGSSNVHAFGLVAGSSSSDFLTTGPMHFYTNSDLDTVSATGFAMQLDTSQRLTIGSMTASQKLNVAGNVTANRYYGNGSTTYFLDPNDATTSAVLSGDVAIGDFSTPAHRLVVRTPGGESGNTEDGVFIKSPFAGGSPVTTDAQPFLSIGCRDTSGGVSRIFLGQNATATSQESLIEYSRNNGTLGVFVKGLGTYTEHVRFGNQSSGTARTRFYGNVGIGTNPTEKLHIDDGFLKVQPPDISGTTPPSITIRSLTNQYQSGMESSGHLTMKSAGSSSNFYWYQGGTNVMRYTNGLYVNQIRDINSDAYYLDPASSGVSLHINGMIDQDFYVTNLNSAWTAPGTSRDQGFIFGRFQASASNAPSTNDNANWFANIYSHSSGGTASYGIQLAGSNAGSGENALQLRNVSNGSFASWRKVYHEGHKPTYSELGTMAYSNLTGTPTIPTDFVSKASGGTFSGNVSIDQGTSGDAILTIRSDTDNNNEGDHPSIRLKQDGDLVDYRLGLGITDGQVNTNDNEFCITNITNNGATSFRFSPNNGTNSYLVYHDNYHPDADNADTVDNLHASSFLRSDTNDTFTGKLAAGDTNIRRAGMYGIYDSYKTGHIWSMGTGYAIPNDGSNFGNLYGLAYKHTNNTTGGTMGGSHQMVWCNNGSARGSIGYNAVWHAESMKAPIFYDSNDTNYKLDPNGTSNLNHLNVAGTFRFQRSSWNQTGQDDNVTVTVGDSDITFRHNNDDDGDASQYNFKYRSGGNDVDILNFASNYANFTTPYVRCTNNSTDYAQLESNSSGGVLKAVSNGNTNILFRSYGDSYTLNDLGVGISTPSARLHVDHPNVTTPSLTFGSAAGQILQSENSEFAFGLTAASPYPLYIQGRTHTNGARNINLQPVSGRIGIGVANAGYKLDVDGTIRATGDVIAYSDIRVKENIKTIDKSLDKVKKLRGVEYNKIDSTEKNIGVIAQEVEKILPEVVKEDAEGMKSVAYGNITAILIEAIKEQQKQIDELKSIINGSS